MRISRAQQKMVEPVPVENVAVGDIISWNGGNSFEKVTEAKVRSMTEPAPGSVWLVTDESPSIAFTAGTVVAKVPA